MFGFVYDECDEVTVYVKTWYMRLQITSGQPRQDGNSE